MLSWGFVLYLTNKYFKYDYIIIFSIIIFYDLYLYIINK